MDLSDASAMRESLAELFEEAMTALQNALDEFSAVDVGDNFHRRQPLAGISDVRTQPFSVISEDLASFSTTRDADVKLLLVDGDE